MSRTSAPANAGDMPTDRSILEAYRQWLHFEARLLGLELFPEMPDADAVRFVPEGTFAHRFHFPIGKDWRDVPKPSSRAEQVLRAVGVLPRSAEAETEEEGVLMP